MGLASALSTALTGLAAAETTIDVVGNNLANANTVGFKESQAEFATQFLQTMSLGSAPTDNSGGTNPRQTGLGTMVAEITPSFKQGTIQVSSSPTDLAIQKEGFFILQGQGNDRLYTRNGQFKLNSENQMVSITGQRLLGYGVDSNFEVDRSILTPVTIPLGQTAVAEATKNVYLEGQLSPTGDIATTPEVIQTAVLGNGYYTAPTTNAAAALAEVPTTTSTTGTSQAGGSMTSNEDYEYEFVFANQPYAGPPSNPPLSEGTPSTAVSAHVNAGQGSIQLNNIPTPTIPVPPATSPYTNVRIYRRAANKTPPEDFHYITELAPGVTTYTDTMDDATAQSHTTLDQTRLSGKYKYYVTFANTTADPPAGIESRVCLDTAAPTVNVVNGRVVLSDLPTDSVAADGWTSRRIYRSLATDDTKFYYVGSVAGVTDPDVTVIDNTSDDALSGKAVLDMDGPKILPGTRLTDVLRRDQNGYTSLFPLPTDATHTDPVGTLSFVGQKGGRTLSTKTFQVTATSTVQDLMDFMTQALGIQAVGSSTTGGTVDTEGHILLTGNNGVENRINIDLTGMTYTYTDYNDPTAPTKIQNVDMKWAEEQAAIGSGAATDTVVYDSLGTALSLRVTMVLENRDSSETTFRWYADSPDNSQVNTANIAVGTGTITFDQDGHLKRANEDTVNIFRDGYPAVNPLSLRLDFSQISGLAADTDSLAVSRQDGSAAGTLNSFIVGEDGLITGVFSNGVSRKLAQVQLARFANPNGLIQKGENQWAQGVNSGLPIMGDPGAHGIGSLVAGATELSNTDVGGSLINLILASTTYRGNAQVITTIQQMFDVLMNLRR